MICGSSPRLLTVRLAPDARSVSTVAAPVATPTATMFAAQAARMSHSESPTYQMVGGGRSSSFAAKSSRSGAGFASLTWLPSMTLGGRAKGQCSKRLPDLLSPARGRDRPGQFMPFQPADQARRTGKRLRIGVQPVVDRAGSLIDLLGCRFIERLTSRLRNGSRQPPAVGPDQACHLVAVRLQVVLLEGLEPGQDPGPDGVDEGSIEVEEHGRKAHGSYAAAGF